MEVCREVLAPVPATIKITHGPVHAGTMGSDRRSISLLGGRRIAVRVPSASLKLECTGRHDFLGFFPTIRAFSGRGPHLDQFFKTVAAFAFKFINRHD